MQTYKDSVTAKVWSFEDDVVVVQTGGVYSFRSPFGQTIPAPSTLQPYTVPAPTAAELLNAAQQQQNILLWGSYVNANAVGISFTTKAGAVDTYQVDPNSVAMIQETLSGFRAASAVPTGFYWRSATNKDNPFTYADLEGLAAALVNRGWVNFQKLQALKVQVQDATTVADVQKVVW